MKHISLAILLFFLAACSSRNDTTGASRAPEATTKTPAASSTSQLSNQLGNQNIANFSQAKKLALKIHAEHPFTVYCGCRYQDKRVDLKSCGYQVHKDPKRASRLEWEHVVPAQAFGQSFPEWREGAPSCVKRKKTFKGRKCAETNVEFARMEADLYNLWPEIGELNGLRNNYSMAALGTAAARQPASISFGGCRAVIADKKFEPMDQAKGIVARTYLYMNEAYPGRGVVSAKNEKLFEARDKQFPVTDWECKRAEKIRRVQGNENLVLKERCEKRKKAS